MVVERAGVADVVQTKSFVKLRITRRIAGRRLDVSEGVRGRGGDRGEEDYSASRHLRRTQSGPAAGAGSRGESTRALPAFFAARARGGGVAF